MVDVTVYMQVLLVTVTTLTGNYGFYPLLTLTLCLSLIDDTWLNSWTRSALTYKGQHHQQLNCNNGYQLSLYG